MGCLFASTKERGEEERDKDYKRSSLYTRTAKLRNDILMFQQHQVQIFYDHVNPATRRTIDQSAGGKLHDKNAKESWALLEDLSLYDNESWNNPRDFAKPVKAISLPQDVPSTSDRRLIKLGNEVQCLMEAHHAPKSSVQVNKITSSCEICSGNHNTQYCMKNLEQAFVDYASSRTDEAGGKWFTFKPEQSNLGDTYNLSWKSHPNHRLSKFEANFKQQQGKITSKINTFLKAINDQVTGALQSDTVKILKLNINSTSPVLSARSYPMEDPQCLSYIDGSINAITMCFKQPNKSHNDQPQDHETIAKECKTFEEEGKEEKGDPKNINTNPPSLPDPSVSFINKKVFKLNSFLESLNLVPRSSDTKFVCTKENDGDVMLIEIIKKYDDSSEEELGDDESTIMRKQLEPREDPEGIRGINNFIGRIKGMNIFVGNFTYVSCFMIVVDISSIIDPRLSQVVLGKPFVEVSNMTHDLSLGVVKFTDGTNEITYKIPHKKEQYNSLSNLEKEHTKSVYFRNEEDKRRGVEYVMNKILGFYKECLELGPKYLSRLKDEG
ncbi:hypothetical protein Tco_1021937 [Tanacetum coccineum]